MAKIKPPKEEVEVGLEAYKSKTQGIGGFLKEEPADFIVREVIDEGWVLDLESDVQGDRVPGDFTHFTLVKQGWETHRALKEISKKVGVSRNRFSFAGTKDKRALTAQRVCAYKIPIEKLKSVSLGGLRLKDFGYSDERIGLGCLLGNSFRVTVRKVGADCKERIESISRELAAGFPNYFGIQRFGAVRPITHLVGKHIVGGEFEEAVSTYLTATYPLEDEETSSARKELAESNDYKAALRDFPKKLGYEKALLNRLVKGAGYVEALDAFPKNLKRMFVHSYQSFIFNKALSECLIRDLDANMLPLVGYDTEPDDISSGILESEGVEICDFKVPESDDFSSRGGYRRTYANAYEFKYDVIGNKVVFDFRLDKGTYATVLLREYMKSDISGGRKT